MREGLSEEQRRGDRLSDEIAREEARLVDIERQREEARARLRGLRTELASLDAVPRWCTSDTKPDATNEEKVTLFRSLFRGDRLLWIFAWVFHAVLLLIFLGHLRVILNLDALMMKLGMSEASIGSMRISPSTRTRSASRNGVIFQRTSIRRLLRHCSST